MQTSTSARPNQHHGTIANRNHQHQHHHRRNSRAAERSIKLKQIFDRENITGAKKTIINQFFLLIF